MMKQLIKNALQFIGIQNYSDFDLQQDYFNNPSTVKHDADALDRCRFYSPRARLNWYYLSLPGLRCTDDHPSQMLMDLICETESIFTATKRLPSFMPFGEFLENIR